MIPAFPVYLFDVDGTLVDSAADICGALQSVLSSTSCPAVPLSRLRSSIGYHLIDLFTEVFPNYSDAEIEDLCQQYRTAYPARKHASTVLYPGVRETLAELPGRKSTATTKGTPTTRQILEMFGLLPFFDHVQGTDGFPCKPAPDVIFRSLEVFGAKPEDCLMVGDSVPDMEAGRRAGVKICAVRYGYGDPARLAAFKPDYSIDTFAQLLPVGRSSQASEPSGVREA